MGYVAMQSMTGRSGSSNTTPGTRPGKQAAIQLTILLLLSLFLPLSFLLLARISTSRHFSTISDDDFGVFFLSCNYIILCILVSSVSVAAFLHALIHPLQSQQPPPPPRNDDAAAADNHQPGNSRWGIGSLYLCGILVCTVCLELGLEFQLGETTSKRAGSPTTATALLLAVGLHETMLYWSKAVVKPVVEDWFTGFLSSTSNNRVEVIIRRMSWWIEKVGMGLSFGGLWWWRLRDQLGDSVNWWLYYLMVCIGGVRVVKGVVWVCRRLTWRLTTKLQEKGTPNSSCFDPLPPTLHHNV